MLKCTVDGKEIGFAFQHWRGIGEAVQLQAVTECQLLVGDKWHVGVAACHVTDNFDKETGRKISLTRALLASNLTKVEREAVWIRYWNRDLTNKEYASIPDGPAVEESIDKADTNLGNG